MKESQGFFPKDTAARSARTSCTCLMHWQTKRTIENGRDEGGRKKRDRREEVTSAQSYKACPVAYECGGHYGIRRTSFISALLDVHVSRSRSRVVSTPRPRRLSAHSENPDRSTPGTVRSKSGTRRLARGASNKGSHPGRRACPRMYPCDFTN